MIPVVAENHSGLPTVTPDGRGTEAWKMAVVDKVAVGVAACRGVMAGVPAVVALAKMLVLPTDGPKTTKELELALVMDVPVSAVKLIVPETLPEKAHFVEQGAAEVAEMANVVLSTRHA